MVLTKNLISNFGARLWAIMASFIVLPYTIYYLGVEAYGLVGFYAMLSALSTILDLGLSTTTSREVARLSIHPQRSQELYNFSKTLEAIYWVTGALLILAIGLCSHWMAQSWLAPKALCFSTVQTSVIGMGFALGLLWPFSFYSGVLIGLEKQLPLNMILIGVTTVRALGTVLLLTCISPTVEAFFVWQSFVSLFQVLLSAVYCRKSLSIHLGFFNLDSLRKVWKFTVSLSAISITTTVLLSLDKLVISKILDLQSFGYYAIAANIASVLHHINVPIYVSFLPRFTQYVEQGKEKELKDSYHLASQILSSLVFPAAALLFFFPVEILTIWRIKAEAINQVIPILRLLLVGTTLNTLLSNATALQFASGQTRLLLIQNIAAVVLGIPLTIWVSVNFGAIGAAWTWIGMHFSFLVLTIPLMHRQLLQGELHKWYRESCVYPLVGAAAFVYLGRLFFFEGAGSLGNFFYLALLFLLAVLICVLLTPALRAQLLRFKLFSVKAADEGRF